MVQPPNEENTIETYCVRVLVPQDSRELNEILNEVTQVFQLQDVEVMTDLVPSRAVQAPYEIVITETNTKLAVPKGTGLMELTRKLCHRIYQVTVKPFTTPHVIFTEKKAFFQNCILTHENIPLHGLSFGNLINNGLFLERCWFSPKDTPRLFDLDENLLDMRMDFEHDNRKILIYLHKNELTERGQPVAYEIEIQGRSIHHMVVDMGEAEGERDKPSSNGKSSRRSDCVCFYIKLKWPPRVTKKIKMEQSQNGRGRGRGNGFLNNGRGRGGGGRSYRGVYGGGGRGPGGYDQEQARRVDKDRLLRRTRVERSQLNTIDENLLPVYIVSNSPYIKLKFPLEGAPNGQSMRDNLYQIISRIKARNKIEVYFGPVATESVDLSKTQVEYQQKVADPKRSAFITHFGVLYTYEALISRGFTVWDDITDAFMELVKVHYKGDMERSQSNDVECSATELILGHLTSIIDEHKKINLYDAFEELALMDVSSLDVFDDRNNCVRVRKIVVTPTRTLYIEAEVMMANRVVRQFNHDFALRVIVRRDDMSKFKKYDKEQVEEICERFKSGICIGRRKYRFLAWSNSQLRDHGFYAFADTLAVDFFKWREEAERKHAEYYDMAEDDLSTPLRVKLKTPNSIITADDVRMCLGKFTHIRNVAKMMSRVGQCFTQTQNSIKLLPSQMVVENDYLGAVDKRNNERYVFSDGVGTISKKRADEIAASLELPYTPSAFQIRCGGKKGMLSVDPRLIATDDDDEPTDVIFRDSMSKFHCTASAYLEIVKYSQPTPLTLNRPFIMILDEVSKHHGREEHDRVTKGVHRLLEKHLFAMADMLLDEKKSAGALKDKTPLDIDFPEMVDVGFMFTTEPFFRGLLLAIHQHSASFLQKAKIDIPHSKGRTMYGILDETGVLCHGQVFIQYSEKLNDSTCTKKVLTGNVMVTKNPSISAGDVRILKAIDIEYLHHLVDVIVFPRQGPRPHADEMAGSDLDGDEYSVCWDPDIMISKHEAPRDFEKKKKPDLDHEPLVSDMLDHFCEYIVLDQIGYISLCHLAQTDKRNIFDPIPASLAEKHSDAVDFPKTGYAPEPVSPDEDVRVWPDFIDKTYKASYRSKKLCGQIYRKIKKVTDIVALGQCKSVIKADPDLVEPGWEDYMERAIVERNRYFQRIQSLLDTYGIEDEFQMVSGHMIRIRNRLSDGEKEDFSFFNTEKLVELRIGKTWDIFRQEFFLDFLGEDSQLDDQKDVIDTEEVRKKASAWYMVTYDYKRFGNVRRYLSFPWIVWDVLKRLKMSKIMANEGNIFLAPVEQMLDVRLKEIWCNPVSEENRPGSLKEALRETKISQTYLKVYPDLHQVLCALFHWAEKEKLFKKYLPTQASSSKESKGFAHSIVPVQLILLFLKYGIEAEDDLLGTKLISPADACERERRILSAQAGGDAFINVDENGERLFLEIHRPASLLLSYIKYAASQDFLDLDVIHFTDIDSRYRIRDSHKWRPLHHLAFTAYHHLALTARFDCLHVSSDEEVSDWDFGEEDPVEISWQSSPIRSDDAVHMDNFRSLLMEWSGCDWVEFRPVRRCNVLVVGTGKLEARQNLRHILLHDSLWECYKTGLNPIHDAEF